jgi:lantibiotic modifying enzyme
VGRTGEISESRAWTCALGSHRRDAVLRVALNVAANTAVPRPSRARPGEPEDGAVWRPHTVAQGDAGVALLCAQLDRCFPGEGWDVAAHGFLTSAVRSAEAIPQLGPGLFDGLSGLVFVATTLGRGATRYKGLVAALDEVLLARAATLLDTVRGRSGVDPRAIDVISGLSGLGACLLARREQPGGDAMLAAILAALVELTSPRAPVPHWHTPAACVEPELAGRFPRGRLDLGLAHGIPGPLALMALTLRDGVEVAGQRDALRATCNWLAAQRLEGPWGASWPAMLPVGALGSGAPPRPSRMAWCYGSPGVARTLWLCGEALENSKLRSLAVDAMEAVYRTPVAERGIDSVTFCHGVSGLLQITLRFAHDTGLPGFREASSALADYLLAAYEPNARLGYRSLGLDGSSVEHPGLLYGSAGVALTLLAAATNEEPVWDRLFLLA